MIWLIGLGGSLGAALRYLIGAYINQKYNQNLTPFPIGTLTINCSGSLLLGILANYHINQELDIWMWYFFGVGFCGAYTTFSTFGYEVMNLLQAKKIHTAFLYIITSVLFSGLAAVIGLLFFE